MAHDPDRTRTRLLDAAVRVFSEHGYAGARIAAIAASSGINRERLYANFGNKRQVFETVLAEKLASALDATPVVGTGAAAVGRFAGAWFDACLAAPELSRLVAWEGLELERPIEVDTRRARAARKVDELHAVLPRASRGEAEELLLSVVTLCHGWVTTPNLAVVITRESSTPAQRRAWLVAAVETLAAPLD